MVYDWRVARQRNSLSANECYAIISAPVFRTHHIIVSSMQFNWQVFRKAHLSKNHSTLFGSFAPSYSPNWHKLLTRCENFLSSAGASLMAQVANMHRAIPINPAEQKLIIKYLNTRANGARMHPIAWPFDACSALSAAPVHFSALRLAEIRFLIPKFIARRTYFGFLFPLAFPSMKSNELWAN